jgi:hypothetical protein
VRLEFLVALFRVVFAFVAIGLWLGLGLGLARVEPVELVKVTGTWQFLGHGGIPHVDPLLSSAPEGSAGQTRSIVSADT